ncbi:MAG: PP2C family protein-serine/threonine phosphatase [Bacteroidales bacterium]
MASASGSREPNPRLFKTIQQDVGRIGTDVRRAGIKATVVPTFEDLRQFYLSTEHRERLARMGRVKRALYFAWWLLKGLFFKLTPARRILLLLAFFFFFQGSGVLVSSDRVNVTVHVGWMGIVLLLLVLALELKDKLLAREELEAGRAVQMALMPEPAPALPGWQIWLFTRPANDVGGDLVDFLRIDPQRAFVVLGDVAGKGLPAALLMAKLQATVRGLAPEFTSLPEIGARVNRILNRDGLPNRFATLVYLEVSPTAGRVRILNAGHMPPIVVRGSTIAELQRGSFALGMMPDAPYEEQSTELASGDTLVAYSDGATEAMNAEGDFFGDDRFLALLTSISAVPLADAGARLVGAVDAFVGTARPHDDLSLVLLRRV